VVWNQASEGGDPLDNDRCNVSQQSNSGEVPLRIDVDDSRLDKIASSGPFPEVVRYLTQCSRDLKVFSAGIAYNSQYEVVRKGKKRESRRSLYENL